MLLRAWKAHVHACYIYPQIPGSATPLKKEKKNAIITFLTFASLSSAVPHLLEAINNSKDALLGLRAWTYAAFSH